MTDSSIYGVWTHRRADGGASSETTQTLRDDGTYETHMVFAFEGGCEQHIRHYGTFEVGEATLELDFQSGETSMTGCSDPSENFARRDLSTTPCTSACTGFQSLRPQMPVEAVFDIFRRELEGAWAEGGIFQLTMHPHHIAYRASTGRPATC